MDVQIDSIDVVMTIDYNFADNSIQIDCLRVWSSMEKIKEFSFDWKEQKGCSGTIQFRFPGFPTQRDVQLNNSLVIECLVKTDAIINGGRSGVSENGSCEIPFAKLFDSRNGGESFIAHFIAKDTYLTTGKEEVTGRLEAKINFDEKNLSFSQFKYKSSYASSTAKSYERVNQYLQLRTNELNQETIMNPYLLKEMENISVFMFLSQRPHILEECIYFPSNYCVTESKDLVLLFNNLFTTSFYDYCKYFGIPSAKSSKLSEGFSKSLAKPNSGTPANELDDQELLLHATIVFALAMSKISEVMPYISDVFQRQYNQSEINAFKKNVESLKKITDPQQYKYEYGRIITEFLQRRSVGVEMFKRITDTKGGDCEDSAMAIVLVIVSFLRLCEEMPHSMLFRIMPYVAQRFRLFMNTATVSGARPVYQVGQFDIKYPTLETFLSDTKKIGGHMFCLLFPINSGEIKNLSYPFPKGNSTFEDFIAPYKNRFDSYDVHTLVLEGTGPEFPVIGSFAEELQMDVFKKMQEDGIKTDCAASEILSELSKSLPSITTSMISHKRDTESTVGSTFYRSALIAVSALEYEKSSLSTLTPEEYEKKRNFPTLNLWQTQKDKTYTGATVQDIILNKIVSVKKMDPISEDDFSFAQDNCRFGRPIQCPIFGPDHKSLDFSNVPSAVVEKCRKLTFYLPTTLFAEGQNETMQRNVAQCLENLKKKIDDFRHVDSIDFYMILPEVVYGQMMYQTGSFKIHEDHIQRAEIHVWITLKYDRK